MLVAALALADAEFGEGGRNLGSIVIPSFHGVPAVLLLHPLQLFAETTCGDSCLPAVHRTLLSPDHQAHDPSLLLELGKRRTRMRAYRR